MKRQRRKVSVTEEQQLILALLLVILLAISMLYCLGLASVVLRDTWADTSLPWNSGESPTDQAESMPNLMPSEPSPPVTTAP